MKLSKCRNKGCSNRFSKRSMSHVACGPDCAAALAIEHRLKQQRIAEKVQRQQDKEKLKDMRTIPQLKAAAQKAFNFYIRERDYFKTCICCNVPLNVGAEVLTGGKFDAGHYRSVGSADHLRYNEDNCHAQRKYCNNNKSGNHVNYRIGLIHRIGVERVERLESDNTSVKWTKELLLNIEKTYQAKALALQKLRKQNHDY